MAAEYLTIRETGKGEYEEKKSRFLGEAIHVENEEEASAHVARIRKQYYDARHHCYAWVLGEGSERKKSADDGEPSGTAGQPILKVIEGSGWKHDGAFGVVHRIAGDGSRPGIGAFCLNWACEQAGHLRIDTHPDNLVMQKLLTRLGFEQRGIIHVEEDDDPRFAYEK